MADESVVADLTAYDFDRPLAGIEELRAANPHRFEFEMLTGVVHLDPAKQLIVGFKDMKETDFWTRGHMPGFPLFPGVLMCEAAAQMCGYYYVTQKVGDAGSLLGLAGIDEARFIRQVRPGERLVMVGTGVKVRRRLTRFRIVGQVGNEKAFEAVITGVPLGKLEELRGA
jgi:3-hydroxyacyl-[acyl-carrier-protein] dehydratase